MHDDLEVELRMAVEEGFISPEQVDALREEARRQACSPLEVLQRRGVISEQTLASKRAGALELDPTLTRAPKADGAPTLGPALTLKDRDKIDPPFPVPGWDRYQGVRFLGQGGMGQVFLAYDPRLRRNIALKFVRGDDTQLVRRLLTEARAQARVEHERVCQVHEVGEVHGKPYIAMQFVDGLPLGQLAEELTLEQKVLVLRDAAEGVHAAHRAGLIHRDLKPSNILVERTDDGRLKPFVMDFGLAQDWDEKGATATGSVLGTPHYMSPEQARGEVAALDRRADVYSLGATLYALLTGQPPISGANGLEVLSNITSVEPRPPRAIKPALPADLEAIVLKCLEKDRSARYDSARAFIEDLDRFLAGEPVHARPTDLWYRLRKKALKHRIVVGVATAALLAVTLALGSAAYTHSQATRREQLARSFTEKVEHLEALARYSGLSDLHDTRQDREEIRAQMDRLEAQIREAGELAVGPGHYALGRGSLALGDEAQARTHLEAAWQSGFHEPRAAYALALVLGHLYQDQLLEAERIRTPEQREARRQELQRRFRDPALAWLRQSEGADVPSTDYVAALIAFYEDRFDEALARLDAMGQRLPWFYEAPLLRGDIHRTRAARRWNQGDRKGALEDLETGRAAYAAAASTGESVPEVHQALGELEHTAMLVELYGQGDVLPPFTRGTAAVGRALQASPDSARAHLLEARFHRRLAEARLNLGADVEEPLQKAITAAQAALKLSPTESAIQLELGRCFFLWAQYRLQRNQDPREQLRRADEHFERIALEDRTAEFHVLRGLVFEYTSDYERRSGGAPLPLMDKAIGAYLEALRLDERLLAAWINLGNMYLSRASESAAADPDADLKQAMDALDKARSLNPQHIVPYLSAAQVQEQVAQRLLTRGGDPQPALAKALELYRQGITINPRLPQLYNGVGIVLLQQARELWDRGGDPYPLLEQSQALFDQAITVAPRQGFAFHNISLLHIRRAEYARARGESPERELRAAMESARQAIERLPDHAPPWNTLGEAQVRLAAFELEHGRDPRQNLDQAEKAFRTALARGKEHAFTWVYLGETQALRARWEARRGEDPSLDFEQAEKDFQQALELAPERQEFRIAFSRFYGERAAWQKERGTDPSLLLRRGLEQVDSVLRQRPEWPEARALRASLLLSLAEASPHAEEAPVWRQQALENLSKSLAVNPHLKAEWGSLLLRAQQLVAASP